MPNIRKGTGKGRDDISFHYTKPEMAKDLLKFIQFEKGDVVLDAGSGKNKVWYKHLPDFVSKFECEIEDGCDFLKWSKEVDWVIGNPPYSMFWEFMQKSIEISRKGIAYLLSIRAFNSLTPNRLDKIKDKGFYVNKIHIVMDKRWFGRYYFVLFTKNPSDFITWNKVPY